MLHGRTVDLSLQGVCVRLLDEALHGDRKATDAMTFLHVVERHFSSGIEVRFPSENVRAPAKVIRLIAPSKPGGELSLACRFVRPLTAIEEARILHEEPPLPPDLPLPFEPKAPGTLRLWVYDPIFGEGGGPIAFVDVEQVGDDALEGRVESREALTPESVRETFERGVLPARVQVARATAWEGPMRFLHAREGRTDAPGVRVRFALLQPLRDALAKHVRPRR